MLVTKLLFPTFLGSGCPWKELTRRLALEKKMQVSGAPFLPVHLLMQLLFCLSTGFLELITLKLWSLLMGGSIIPSLRLDSAHTGLVRLPELLSSPCTETPEQKRFTQFLYPALPGLRQPHVQEAFSLQHLHIVHLQRTS